MLERTLKDQIDAEFRCKKLYEQMGAPETASESLKDYDAATAQVETGLKELRAQMVGSFHKLVILVVESKALITDLDRQMLNLQVRKSQPIQNAKRYRSSLHYGQELTEN